MAALASLLNSHRAGTTAIVIWLDVMIKIQVSSVTPN